MFLIDDYFHGKCNLWLLKLLTELNKIYKLKIAISGDLLMCLILSQCLRMPEVNIRK